jgi:hypothetical protein
MKTEEEIKRYRSNPIFGTDFSKRLSQLIENVRTELTQARGHLYDIEFGYPGWKERVEHVTGLLTCGLVSLHVSRQEIIKFEIAKDDKERGRSLKFNPRGIRLDKCPCCFVCGAKKRAEGANDYLNNIAAFVVSKEEGEEIINWFEQGARLDFREWEPDWIQVKVGACNNHYQNLNALYKTTSEYGLLREIDIRESKEA